MSNFHPNLDQQNPYMMELVQIAERHVSCFTEDGFLSPEYIHKHGGKLQGIIEDYSNFLFPLDILIKGLEDPADIDVDRQLQILSQISKGNGAGQGILAPKIDPNTDAMQINAVDRVLLLGFNRQVNLLNTYFQGVDFDSGLTGVYDNEGFQCLVSLRDGLVHYMTTKWGDNGTS